MAMKDNSEMIPAHADAARAADACGQAETAAKPTRIMREMAAVVGDDLMRSIVSDNSRSRERSSILPGKAVEPTPRGTGWVDPPKTDDWRPPGLDVLDRMMNQQDAQDQAERRARLDRGRPADE